MVLDDLSGGFEDNVPEGATFRQRLRDRRRARRRAVRRAPFDYVFHLAAYAAEGLSHFIRRFNYTNNVIGSVNLINEAVRHEVKCFVFTSSIAVYGAEQVADDARTRFRARRTRTGSRSTPSSRISARRTRCSASTT